MVITWKVKKSSAATFIMLQICRQTRKLVYQMSCIKITEDIYIYVLFVFMITCAAHTGTPLATV